MATLTRGEGPIERDVRRAAALRALMTDPEAHWETCRRRAARRLAELLAERPFYRQRWVREARRSPGERVNYTAIARVLMDWWFHTGEQSTENRDLPLDLIRRALTGQVLTPQTLNHLILAFGFTDEDREDVWAIYDGSYDPDDGQALERPHECEISAT